MSNKSKSFLYLISFMASTLVYQIVDKKNEVDETPQIAKVETIYVSTLAGMNE